MFRGWLDQKTNANQLSKDQVIIFGTDKILAEYVDSGYSLGYIPKFGSVENILNVLFREKAIINRCQKLECEYLILPIGFANPSLVDSAKAKGD